MLLQAVKAREGSPAGAYSFLQDLLGKFTGTPFSVRLWDGSSWSPTPHREPNFTLVLKHPGALRRMFFPPNQLTLGEAYIFDDFDIEGDIVAAFELADHIVAQSPSFLDNLRRGLYLLALPGRERPGSVHRPGKLAGSVHSPRRDAKAITYHYDVSNDFYRLWLDQQMVYSCAYFSSPDESLEAAQERKLDYLCRKLRLRKGERLLDIGCGWGGLILHAARRYGVTARGITLSAAQVELATERIRELGLQDRCRVELCDYREAQETRPYDKLVSVGMFEHVGQSRLEEYFRKVWRLLRPGGVFLNHGIASTLAQPFPQGPSFIDRYVFPDGECLPVATTLRTAESCGFEIRDLESLREHYAMTLRRWVRRLEARHSQILRFTDEVTYRIWRIYMAGSAHGFGIGRLNLYQTLLMRPQGGSSGLPLSRADWYV